MKVQNTINIFIQDDITSPFQSSSTNFLKNSLTPSIEESYEDSQYVFSSQLNKSCNAKQNSKKNQSRSVHHNSQKHAVTTFKHMINFQFSGQQSAAHELAKKIWKIFLHCKGGKNKELLSMVLGWEQAQEKRILKKFKQYGFGQILEYDQKIIKDAQNVIRNMVIQQMTPENFQRHLKNRKMAKKEGFKLYMLNLIEELNNGPIRRRLAKDKSEGIASLVQVDEMLCFSDEA